MAKFRIVGISFDHMHMGDLLRLVHEHPDAEIAGIFDPDRSAMEGAIANFNVPDDRVFTDFDACMAAGPYDMAILCSATADHADSPSGSPPTMYTSLLKNLSRHP
jgi:predicted dehydrogenase